MSQNPLDRIKSVDWRGIVKTATNKMKQYTMNLSPLEIAVEEATNMDSWGPHGSAMNGNYLLVHLEPVFLRTAEIEQPCELLATGGFHPLFSLFYEHFRHCRGML